MILNTESLGFLLDMKLWSTTKSVEKKLANLAEILKENRSYPVLKHKLSFVEKIFMIILLKTSKQAVLAFQTST